VVSELLGRRRSLSSSSVGMQGCSEIGAVRRSLLLLLSHASLSHALTITNTHHCGKGIYKIVNWKTINFHSNITIDFVPNMNPFT